MKKNDIDPNHGYDLRHIALVEKQIKNEDLTLKTHKLGGWKDGEPVCALDCWCGENGEEE